ncbi:HTH domain-containing protein [Natronococcus wangiae]|uniref:HTH domain-containing protein n=1 Tax=Natronococcus wangiae TaxID=3068275 RepID=UPI00273EB139|nr:HTH domain-containing protein [Natronococcus sp. AD5]
MSSKNQLRPTELAVTCHVRAPLLLEPVDSKVETLQRCEENGQIDALRLQSWPDEVSLEPETPDQEVIDRFKQFEQWADAHGVSVRPPFRIRTVTSLVDDEPKRVLVTPLLCLAFYYDNQLVGVYPYSDGESTYTSTEVIAELTTGAVPTPINQLSAPAASSTEDTTESLATNGLDSADRKRVLTPSSCPHCDGALVNVQGILACDSCKWNDGCLDELESSGAKLVYLSLTDSPKSVDTLKTALDLKMGTVYGLLRTLVERGLVEQTKTNKYRVSQHELGEETRRHAQH